MKQGMGYLAPPASYLHTAGLVPYIAVL